MSDDLVCGIASFLLAIGKVLRDIGLNGLPLSCRSPLGTQARICETFL